MCSTVQAEIIAESLLSFPAKTESVEYDNLYALRRLPNYAALRQRFTGKPLEDAKAALGKLDIEENQVHEVVLGNSSDAFYGLMSGAFSATAANKSAKKNRIWPRVVNTERVYCPKGTSCLVFLEDSLAAFGTFDQLKLILEARLGSIARLASNRTLSVLMNGTQSRAPVRGVVYGGQLNAVLADTLLDQSGLNLDWKKFSSNISALAYSVFMDGKAHVAAKLECTSTATAALIRQVLSALAGVESVATKVGKDPASMPFENLQVSTSGNLVDLKMDTPLPTS